MLHFVPTPIGNLEDITLKAIRLFKSADTVICEDPTVFFKLLKLLNIENKPKLINIIKNHEFNQIQIQKALSELAEDPSKTVLVVTDAGTPGVSDPGFLIVKIAQELSIEYCVEPGASALLPAVVASGLVSKGFIFLGFPPIKKGRQTFLKKLSRYDLPVVIYESSHRIERLIENLELYIEPNRKVFIIREISKKFEQKWLGQIKDLNPNIMKWKGEFVIVIKAID